MIKHATASEAEFIVQQCVMEVVNEGEFYRDSEPSRRSHKFGDFLNVVCKYVNRIMHRDKLFSEQSAFARTAEGTFVPTLRRRVAMDAWLHYELPATPEFVACQGQTAKYMFEAALEAKPKPKNPEKTIADYTPEEAYKWAFNKVRQQVKRYESWSYFKDRVTGELSVIPIGIRRHVEFGRFLCELWESVKGYPLNPEFLKIKNTLSFVPSVTTKEPIMANASTPFEVITFIYGTDVKSMTEDQLIESIKRAEADIAKLGVVKTASKKLEARKAELQTAIDKMVEALDAK